MKFLFKEHGRDYDDDSTDSVAEKTAITLSAALAVAEGEDNTVQVLSDSTEAAEYTAVSEVKFRKEFLQFSEGGLRSMTVMMVRPSDICYRECNNNYKCCSPLKNGH